METRSLIFGAVSFLLLAIPASAHHSHSMYAPDEVTIVGTVEALQWTNPHIFIYLVVRNEDGETSNWVWEAGAPFLLLRQGWPEGNPKPGDEISVTGRPLKTGRGGVVRTVTFADQSEFHYDGPPPK